MTKADGNGPITRNWLVTGCSAGFGRALAGLLLERGQNVTLTARDPATLTALVEAFPNTGMAVRLDVNSADAITEAVDAAHRRFGAIDVLINNAGAGHLGMVEDAPVDDARALMETNYFGALAMIKAVVPEMVARRAGQIVNIGSVSGRIGLPGIGYYCASKFALAGLSDSLAAELAPLGIQVTLAELGPFETNFARAMTCVPFSEHYDLASLAEEAGNSAWAQGGEPAELGAAALLKAIVDPSPPRRLILGQQALEILDKHDARRQAEARRWLPTSKLEDTDVAAPA